MREMEVMRWVNALPWVNMRWVNARVVVNMRWVNVLPWLMLQPTRLQLRQTCATPQKWGVTATSDS
jgi:hypothetical protein